ncbi:MAG: prepilin-type N-terminal cleavage/methylation domain-containing protein [Fimbriimonadaceae bacterium]
MKRAFTLIELLVVIAIIAILAAILFPVFAQAKSSAKQAMNLSNMKQIGLAGQLYANDYEDSLPADNINSGQNWGRYYWVFLLTPYIKDAPADAGNAPKGFFWSPLAPAGLNYQVLSGARARAVWPEPAQSWGLQCYRLQGNNCNELRYWTTYAINEHITDFPGGLVLTAWQAPSESFFVLEATDSEIEGDELDELFSRSKDCSNYPDPDNADATRGGHAGGTTFAYLDGHAKWRKTTWGPQGECSTDASGNPLLMFPPTTDGGVDVRVKGWTPIFNE